MFLRGKTGVRERRPSSPPSPSYLSRGTPSASDVANGLENGALNNPGALSRGQHKPSPPVSTNIIRRAHASAHAGKGACDVVYWGDRRLVPGWPEIS